MCKDFIRGHACVKGNKKGVQRVSECSQTAMRFGLGLQETRRKA